MTDSLVRAERAGAVATLTLDSPHNRNALSAGLIGQLTAELASCVADPAVRVIVVTHTGPVFCSGADLKETAAAFGGEGRGVPAAGMGDVLAAVWESPKPVLARVGVPGGAGSQLDGGVGVEVAVAAAGRAERHVHVQAERAPAQPGQGGGWQRGVGGDGLAVRGRAGGHTGTVARVPARVEPEPAAARGVPDPARAS